MGKWKTLLWVTIESKMRQAQREDGFLGTSGFEVQGKGKMNSVRCGRTQN